MVLDFFLKFLYWVILPGFATHLLMYLKCKAALDWRKLSYSPLGYYDILEKGRPDPRSYKIPGIVIILNGTIAFAIFFLSQIYKNTLSIISNCCIWNCGLLYASS